MGDDDLPLVRALQAGDESALGTLMERHQAALFSFIYRYVQNAADAEELTQEVFVRAYFKIGSFTPRAKFSSWLYTIATNLCRDHAGSRAQRQRSRTSSLIREDGEPIDLPTDAYGPDEHAIKNERLQAVAAAIEALPHDLKTALILTALEGLSHLEAAEKLATTPKAIETRVYRARQRLEKTLSQVS